MASLKPDCTICVMLNIQCDMACASGENECPVRSSNREQEEHGGRVLREHYCSSKGSLTDGLHKSFESAFQIDHSQWLFPQRKGTPLLILDFSPLDKDTIAQHTIRDLACIIRASVQPDPKSAYLSFLNQFMTISRCWGRKLLPHTEDVIQRAAEYQRLLLMEVEDRVALDEKLVTMNALRCVVLTFELSVAVNYLPQATKFDDTWLDRTLVHEAKVRRISGYSERYRCDPRIAVEYWKADTISSLYQKRRIEDSATLCRLLKTTVDAAESLLLRKRPRDWPTIFYVLYLLQVVKNDLYSGHYFTGLKDAIEILDKALQALCALFLFCTGGSLEPLSLDFDSAWYSALVGVQYESTHHDHYKYVHDVWVQEAPLDIPVNVENFMLKLDDYAAGFID